MTRAARLLFWGSQPVVIGLTVWLMLGARHFDAHVPLALDHDATFAIAQARATATQGWWWTNPDLGALSQDDPLLRPQAAHIDQLLLRLVGLAIPDPIRAVSATWLVMLILAAAAATWCLQRLGVSPTGAWCTGVLFALSPFALARNTTYLGLAPYLVPFAATTAILLAGARAIETHGRTWASLLVGNVLLALNATYFALAGIVMIGVGTVATLVRPRSRTVIAVGASMLGIVAVLSLLNVGPALDVSGEGAFRDAANAEQYGLKLRALVTPLPDHWFGPFRSWAATDARQSFPVDSESVNSRLGVVAAVGLLILLGALLFPTLVGEGAAGDAIRLAARLAFAAMFIATVGGLGAVFSELVTPHIRVFARITPFLAFFSLVAVALTIDRMTRNHDGRRGALWAVVLLLGLFDQSVALRPLVASRARIAEEYRELRTLMDSMEPELPASALVFQLPARPFPRDPGVERMAPLDAYRPQIVSRRLRWSYPATTPALQRLQADAAATPARDLPAFLASRGVAAIVLDRFGYEGDGNPMLHDLLSVPGATEVLVATPRYVVMAIKRPGLVVPDPASSVR